jgi:hypothetical protein
MKKGRRKSTQKSSPGYTINITICGKRKGKIGDILGIDNVEKNKKILEN